MGKYTITEPVATFAIEPQSLTDTDRMIMAIFKLTEEDKELRMSTNRDTSQITLGCMGETHLERIIDRIHREFNVRVTPGSLRVAYNEAFGNTVEHHEVLQKHSGGRSIFADIRFSIGPADEEWLQKNQGKCFQFVNDVSLDSIPKEFVPAIQKGFETAMKKGVLSGYPVNNMKVTISGGSYHDEYSDAISFELCARNAFLQVGHKARPTLLEPVMKVEIQTPDQYRRNITDDLKCRRGIVAGSDSRTNLKVIKAEVPLRELFGYATQLRSLSHGSATCCIEFSHYSCVPYSIAQIIVEEQIS